MPTDRTPVSDDKTLYIAAGYSSFTLEELRENAMAHFDLDKAEAEVQLDITIENVQVRGCMCHHDHSDWDLYFVVTRNTPGKVLSNDAELLASACDDAYSAGNYPNGHWAKCAQELLDRGLDIDEAEEFLWRNSSAPSTCVGAMTIPTIQCRQLLSTSGNILTVAEISAEHSRKRWQICAVNQRSEHSKQMSQSPTGCGHNIN